MDDSYLVVNQDAARHIPYQALVVPPKGQSLARAIKMQAGGARRKLLGRQQIEPRRVIWIEYHPDSASHEGDLVDSVVSAVRQS